MNIRKVIKRWLFTKCPGFSGSFRYFGIRVFFPKKSASFERVCDEGIFEPENLRILSTFARPNTVVFDVGAHLGLMAIPILHSVESVSVISFEPSPNTWPYLERSVRQSRFGTRWEAVRKAVGTHCGAIKFACCAPENAFYDGIVSTGRAPITETQEVEMTTIDVEWSLREKPTVSAIKIDVEGAELAVLRGAKNCLRECRPTILLEWQPLNFSSYHVNSRDLLDFADEERYVVLTVPNLVPVTDPDVLLATSKLNESFVLIPKG